MKEIENLLEKTAETAKKYAELKRLVSAPEIIADNRYWRKLLSEMQSLEEIAALREKLLLTNEKYEQCLRLLETESDGEMKKLLAEEARALSDECRALYEKTNDLLALEGSANEALVEIVPSGNKATEYADVLSSALRRYADEKGLTATIKSKKPLTILFTGAGASAYMREENGVHKFVEDTKSYSVTVTLLPRFAEANEKPDEKDIRIDLFHSGGAGGQNINKVETAIRITHLPTGIVVTCQDERSQLQNKRKALATLKEKLAEAEKKKQEQRREELRKKASETVVCVYYPLTGTVTKGEDKYDYTEYIQGKRRKL